MRINYNVSHANHATVVVTVEETAGELRVGTLNLGGA